jgi:hypothetical protein
MRAGSATGAQVLRILFDGVGVVALPKA